MKEKLVRDKIPDIIKKNGGAPRFRVLDPGSWLNWLRIKHTEESEELLQASGRAELLEELADVKEVFDTLCRELSIAPEEVSSVQETKRTERGGFTKFYVLEMPD